METASVHHIEFLVRNGESISRDFVSKYGFVLFAKRTCDLARQWVLKSHHAVFLITQPTLLHQPKEKSLALSEGRENDFYLHSNQLEYKGIYFKGNNGDLINTVNNVALKVKNVGACLQRLQAADATILKPETKIVDENGEVNLAIIKSCVGNVIHTLIDCDRYNGPFLPHFDIVRKSDSVNPMKLTHFDHVTFACEVGSSSQVLQWYEECLGMRRFLMNRDENTEEGFVIDTTDIGLRLKAMEYWHCAEVGITTQKTPDSVNSIKFVIAEALPDQGPNQVDTFLKEHGGPGIQHIGLHTWDIVTTVSDLMSNGVDFAEPPYTYYTEVGKLEDIERIGQNVAILKTRGILVDMELDHEEETGGKTDSHGGKKYLMQKFTKPLFDRNTFFLEVIHRVGATGFGSGNITALWRSVQAYLSSQQTCGEIVSS